MRRSLLILLVSLNCFGPLAYSQSDEESDPSPQSQSQPETVVPLEDPNLEDYESSAYQLESETGQPSSLFDWNRLEFEAERSPASNNY